MKLSKKGKSRIHEMIDCAFEAHPDDAKGVQVLAKKYLTECDDFELEPDDFEGAVILTVEEAKEIAVTMFVYHELCQKFLIGDDNFVIKASKVSHNLDKKIEQAEKQ